MDRREVVKKTAVAIPALLAGCGQFTENPDEELSSASEHIQKAGDSFETQAENIGGIGEKASFDPKPIRKELAAASKQLDTASKQASSDEASKKIKALRTLVTFLDTLTAAFVDLAAAQRIVDKGLSQYSSNQYQQAVGSFENGDKRLKKADTHYQKAETTLEESDLSVVNVDVKKVREKLHKGGQYLDALRTFTRGAASFTRGMADFEDGSTAFENSSYGNANTTFKQAADHFSKAHERLSPPKDAPTEVVDPITFLRDTSTALEELAKTMGSMSTMMTSFQTVQSYLDANRYDDAISTLQSIQGEMDTAGKSLDRAQKALSSIDSSGSISAIELEQAKKDFSKVDSRLTALEPLIAGMIDFIKGTRALQKGSVDAEKDRYAEAADHFETASTHYGNAHTDFKEGEGSAPAEIKSTFVDLVCQSGAFHDGASLYAEAYRAAADGNYDRANKKIKEGDKAFNRCDSGSTSSDLGFVSF